MFMQHIIKIYCSLFIFGGNSNYAIEISKTDIYVIIFTNDYKHITANNVYINLKWAFPNYYISVQNIIPRIRSIARMDRHINDIL